MPSTKLRKKRSSPLSIPRQEETSPQINGLYVHFSPPKVLQAHPSIVRQWIRAGDLKQLEHMILEGQGCKLIGEYSPDPKVRAFLKQVPALVKKISEAHDAVTKGDLTQLQKLIETKLVDSSVKNIFVSKDQTGMTLLHKAAYYGYPEIVKFLISKFPSFVNMRDRNGKAPLHYCGASKEAGKIWPILTKAGADIKVMDSRGKLPSYYMERSNEIQLPDEKSSAEAISNFNSDKNLIIKPSNIRIWIHDRDLRKLQSVIWEGHGGKLRVETSNHPKVKRFLEGVPYILNVIKDVHAAVVNNDFEEFLKRSSPPAPLEILESKDSYGLNPLHKAAGLGRLKIAKNILNRNPKLVFSVDHKGKTPLHYAAVLKDDTVMYNLLMANNSDETAVDNNNKTPSYYKENPKEISIKLLETIPEAPRISQTFPPTWDWSLFQANASVSATQTSVPTINLTKKVENGTIENFQTKENLENEPLVNTEKKLENQFTDVDEDQVQSKEEPTKKTREKNNDEPLFDEDNENSERKGEESAEYINRNESSTQKTKDNTTPKTDETFDIWTNEDDSKSRENLKRESQNYGEDLNEQEDDSNGLGVEKNAEKMGNSVENESFVQSHRTNEVDTFDDAGVIGKTEREIAEERQRLLDEGMLYINTEDEEIGEEDKKLNEIIEAEDLEKLASLVIDGDGNKLLGKRSKNPEIQNFLDKLPLYMAKITAVHQAARNGSLRNLQAALDRRKFAIAKESSNKLGATPLHVAVLFGNTNIVKYLGGRFPETLNYKDNFGRTPLHYAATLPDNGYFSNILKNLGGDGTIKDDAGHTPGFYQENPEELTQKKLLKDFGSPPTTNTKSMSRDPEHSLLNIGDENSFTNGVSSPITDPSVHDTEPEESFDEGMPISRLQFNESVNDANNPNDYSLTNFTSTDRDEYGQSILHFAAARAHGRNGLFQLIQESNVNLGYRDELYRTARDIALQANIPENIDEIDKYVISLAARGETEKLIELFLEGYDHIMDLEDDEDIDVVTIAKNKNHQKTAAFLKAIPSLEDKREQLLKAIRAGNDKLVENIIEESKNGRFIVVGKNITGRCSLHAAVLCQQKEIAEMISQKYPETLRVGDNLERTPLHYAMGVEEVETLSKILIKCGAKRVLKDLKGRQPTYYFMNRSEILKLQEEENSLRE